MADTAESDGAARGSLAVVWVLGFSSMSAALMQSLVIPIQGRLPELLGTTASSASWVVTGTLLGGAVAMPVAGRVADILGKKQVLVASALILLIGSGLCAVGGGLVPLLTGRVLQGIAMGYIPVAISLVREVTPPNHVNAAMSAVSATLGVGGALGLPLAAWIVETFDWRALFWTSSALALIVTVLTAALVPQRPPVHRAPFDLIGALGLSAGVAAVLIGLTKAGEWGWGAPVTLGFLGGGVVVLLAWGLYEYRHAAPLVDLRTLGRAPVLLTNLAALAVGFGMMAQSIVVPQLLEMPTRTGYGLGQTIMATGLWMAPAGLMMLAFSPVSSAMLTRWGGRRTLAAGAGVLACGYLVGVFAMGSPWTLMIATCVASAGVGIGYAAMPALIMQSVPADEAASSVSVNALARSMGTTIAGAVMALVLAAQTQPDGGAAVPTGGAFQLCFVIGAAAAIAAAFLALAIPRVRAARAESEPAVAV